MASALKHLPLHTTAVLSSSSSLYHIIQFVVHETCIIMVQLVYFKYAVTAELNHVLRKNNMFPISTVPYTCVYRLALCSTCTALLLPKYPPTKL